NTNRGMKKIQTLARRVLASNIHEAEEYKRLNWAQREAILALLRDIADNSGRLYVDMPTGSGKTAVFLTLQELLTQQTFPGEALPKFMVMAPTRLLMTQSYDEAGLF